MRHRHVQAEAAFRERKKETLPVDNAMMDLFNGMVQKMKYGGGIFFAVDLMQEYEETLVDTP